MPPITDEAPSPPPGFSSWLEYVVQAFDYRLAAAPFLFERDPANTQRLIAEAVHAEWHDLKVLADRNSQSQ